MQVKQRKSQNHLRILRFFMNSEEEALPFRNKIVPLHRNPQGKQDIFAQSLLELDPRKVTSIIRNIGACAFLVSTS